jgi:hypothetical protein
MGSIAINQTIAGIITIGVIAIIALIAFPIFLNGQSNIGEIWDNVWNSEEKKQEAIDVKGEEAYQKLFSDIDQYCYTENIQTQDCHCYISSRPSLNEETQMIIVNTAQSAQVSLVNNKQEYLGQEQKEYKLGLFVKYQQGDQNKIGCYIPDNFFIKGRGEGHENEWYVTAKDDRIPEGGVDLYKDKDKDDEHYALRGAALFTRVEEDTVCMLTTLIEQNFAHSIDNDNMIYDIRDIDAKSLDKEWDATMNAYFFNENYCVKEQPLEVQPTVLDVYKDPTFGIPFGTYSWVSSKNLDHGDSDFFGTEISHNLNTYYACGIEEYSFTMDINSIVEANSPFAQEVIGLFNSEYEGIFANLRFNEHNFLTNDNIELINDMQLIPENPIQLNEACSFRVTGFTFWSSIPKLTFTCPLQTAENYDLDTCPVGSTASNIDKKGDRTAAGQYFSDREQSLSTYNENVGDINSGLDPQVWFIGEKHEYTQIQMT